MRLWTTQRDRGQGEMAEIRVIQPDREGLGKRMIRLPRGPEDREPVRRVQPDPGEVRPRDRIIRKGFMNGGNDI